MREILLGVLILTSTLGFFVPVSGDKVAFTGDVDCKTGQYREFEIMKDNNVTALVIAGDYEYTNSNCIISALDETGFNNENTILAVGNHDKCSDVEKFMAVNNCWYHKVIGNIDFIVMDGNQKDFGKGSQQYKDVQKWIDQSTAKYQVVVIHQPFITLKSTHGANGEFKDYNPLFDRKVELVDQAHNHNYQRFIVGNITYLLTGTGWHDSGKNMYPLSGDTDKYGNKADAKITGKNGFTLVTFGKDSIEGRFIDSLSTAVLDSFSIKQKNQQPQPPITNSSIDTEKNEVCACVNGTDTNPPPNPVDNSTKPIAQNVTVTVINNATEIGNSTKIITDIPDVAIIPTKNNTQIKILANLSEEVPVLPPIDNNTSPEPLPPLINMTEPPVINNTLPQYNNSINLELKSD